MRQMQIFVIALTLLVVGYGDVAESAAEKPKQLYIGVYIRTGFQQCLEDWTPTANRLSRANPGYEFVVIPLATREDMYEYLENERIDFLIADSAIYLSTEERFGTLALGCVINPYRGGPDYTGSLIRKANRDDLADLQDLRKKKVSAVKPWSLSGWLMQWKTLKEQGINPIDDLTMQFEGTHLDVIQAVLDGTADVGTVGTDILQGQIDSGAVDPKSLWIFDREGEAVPLTSKAIASTEAYPSLVFAKAAKTTGKLAESVHVTLISPVDPSVTPVDRVKWMVPQNYQKVRNLLRDLIGTDFAYTTSMIPERRTMMLVPIEVVIVVLVVMLLQAVFLVVWWRTKGRANERQEQLRIAQSELEEARASKNMIETILTRAKCGMDIINEKYEIIYMTPGLEHQYGPWRGKKCHEYYWGSAKPCVHCPKLNVGERRKSKDPYIGSCNVTIQEDWLPIGDPSEKGKESKMLQVPFYDENGRWLYARIHFPPEFLQEVDAEKIAAGSHG